MAESTRPNRLSAEECLAKAQECRDLAQCAAIDAHRIMLLHMAETWGRIAGSLSKDA